MRGDCLGLCRRWMKKVGKNIAKKWKIPCFEGYSALALWGKWKNKVDEHNDKQTYATHEECWDYFDIFAPVLWFVVGWVFVDMIFGLIVAAICSVCMWINWKCYD